MSDNEWESVYVEFAEWAEWAMLHAPDFRPEPAQRRQRLGRITRWVLAPLLAEVRRKGRPSLIRYEDLLRARRKPTGTGEARQLLMDMAQRHAIVALNVPAGKVLVAFETTVHPDGRTILEYVIDDAGVCHGHVAAQPFRYHEATINQLIATWADMLMRLKTGQQR